MLEFCWLIVYVIDPPPLHPATHLRFGARQLPHCRRHSVTERLRWVRSSRRCQSSSPNAAASWATAAEVAVVVDVEVGEASDGAESARWLYAGRQVEPVHYLPSLPFPAKHAVELHSRAETELSSPGACSVSAWMRCLLASRSAMLTAPPLSSRCCISCIASCSCSSCREGEGQGTSGKEAGQNGLQAAWRRGE